MPALSRPRSSVFGRRPIASNRWEPDDLRSAPGRFDVHGDRVSLLLHTDNLAADAHVDAFLLEEIGDSLRDILVLARDQTRRKLDDGDLASEAPIDLRKFKADVAAAQHDRCGGRKSTSIIELLVR